MKSKVTRPAIPSLDELRKLMPGLRDVNTEYEGSLSGTERMAITIARRVGTPGFFVLVVLWTAGWAYWNLHVPPEMRFDTPRSFDFWVYLSNVLQIALMPLLLIASNLQARHAERRADIQYEINARAQTEIEAVLEHLEFQQSLLLTLLEKVEGEPADAKQLARAGAEVIDQQRATIDALTTRLQASHQQISGSGAGAAQG